MNPTHTNERDSRSIMGIRFRYETTVIHTKRTAMKMILIVLFGTLAFQGHVFAESWEERAG